MSFSTLYNCVVSLSLRLNVMTVNPLLTFGFRHFSVASSSSCLLQYAQQDLMFYTSPQIITAKYCKLYWLTFLWKPQLHSRLQHVLPLNEMYLQFKQKPPYSTTDGSDCLYFPSVVPYSPLSLTVNFDLQLCDIYSLDPGRAERLKCVFEH